MPRNCQLSAIDHLGTNLNEIWINYTFFKQFKNIAVDKTRKLARLIPHTGVWRWKLGNLGEQLFDHMCVWGNNIYSGQYEKILCRMASDMCICLVFHMYVWYPSRCPPWGTDSILSAVAALRPISHNALFCNRNVHISVTKWCIVGYVCDASWDLWDGSLDNFDCTSKASITMIPSTRATSPTKPLTCLSITLPFQEIGPCLNMNTVFLCKWIPIFKRRSRDRLICISSLLWWDGICNKTPPRPRYEVAKTLSINMGCLLWWM